jgi:hypothetical protein
VQDLPQTMQPRGPRDSAFQIVWRNIPVLLRAAAMTVFLSVVSMPIAIASWGS